MSEKHITLYGDDAERFEEVQKELERRHGWEPCNAATVRFLMGQMKVQ